MSNHYLCGDGDWLSDPCGTSAFAVDQVFADIGRQDSHVGTDPGPGSNFDLCCIIKVHTPPNVDIVQYPKVVAVSACQTSLNLDTRTDAALLFAWSKEVMSGVLRRIDDFLQHGMCFTAGVTVLQLASFAVAFKSSVATLTFVFECRIEMVVTSISQHARSFDFFVSERLRPGLVVLEGRRRHSGMTVAATG